MAVSCAGEENSPRSITPKWCARRTRPPWRCAPRRNGRRAQWRRRALARAKAYCALRQLRYHVQSRSLMAGSQFWPQVHPTGERHEALPSKFSLSRRRRRCAGSAVGDCERANLSVAAGGAFDVIARVMTPRLSQILQQQVIVENVGAAAGIVGTGRVAQAAPDGYSMLLGTVGTHAYNPALYKKLPYNPVSDFAPVGLVAEQPMVLIARKDFPPNTLPEFVAYVKANSAKLQYGSAGVGSTTHLACALFNAASGINVTHIPYRGGGPAMSDMIGGQIQYMCSNAPGAVPQIQGGSVKAIALLQRERSPLMPDLPT